MEFRTRLVSKGQFLKSVLTILLALGTLTAVAGAEDRIPARDAEQAVAPEVPATPNFRRHVLPLLGRLGCNGRTCHGSFQGQGGFRLSLFGYDLATDHQALTEGDEPRINRADPAESLILYKPTHGDEHGGGQRFAVGGWQYDLLRRWVETGAHGVREGDPDLVKLEVLPREVVIAETAQRRPLRILAFWSDGSVEDVTALCRFQTNDEAVAEVSSDGWITGKAPGDTHIVAFYDRGVAVTQALRPVSPQVGPAYPDVPTPTRIDELVINKLRKLGVIPSPVCSDGEFLRRVSLDLTGTLPTPREVEAFTADPASDKRAAKIEELLTRPTYVARWTTKLCEITGNSPQQFQDNAPPEEYARDWYEWIARRVRENVPYDELVAGMVLGRSRLPGESYEAYITRQSAYYRAENPTDFTARETMPYYWAKRTMRKPEERAQNFSYAFLGVRIECAQCHKHPFDQWTRDDFRRLTAFFDGVGFGVAPDGRKTYQALIDKLADKGNQAQRERARLLRAQRGEIVPWKEVFLADPGTRVENGKILPATDRVMPRVLGGDAMEPNDGDDPRRALLDWMRRRDNPYFARVFVNRVWAEYFGVGIINPPDDLNLANPPSNAALLDYLADGFIGHGFEMQWLHREITNSQTYQRSARANETNRLDERNFSRAVFRRLPAEVLLDALTQATAGSAELARAATDVAERAIGPQGGALVGRRKAGDYAASVFGRAPRDANCDCSASTEPNLLQAVYLQNDKEVLAALDRKDGWLNEVRTMLKGSRRESATATDALIEEAFLRTLSRPPTEAETERSAAYVQQVGDPVEGLHDLLWVLLNTREFITNH